MKPSDQAAIMRLRIYALSKKMKDWQDQLSKGYSQVVNV